MINDNGLTATADELQIGKALLGYWLLKLQITVVRVALGPNDKIEITLNATDLMLISVFKTKDSFGIG